MNDPEILDLGQIELAMMSWFDGPPMLTPRQAARLAQMISTFPVPEVWTLADGTDHAWDPREVQGWLACVGVAKVLFGVLAICGDPMSDDDEEEDRPA